MKVRAACLIALVAGAACKPRSQESSLRMDDGTYAQATAHASCPVVDTPTLITFIQDMHPAPAAAADVYRALRASRCMMSTMIGILSDLSMQPADPATNSPRSFVTVDAGRMHVILSTGPEGRIEVASFPVGDQGQHLTTTDEQFADVDFARGQLEIKHGAEKAECDSCHFGYVPVAIGADDDGRPTGAQPFPLMEWHDGQCPDHPMCANVRAMLGL